MVTFEGSDAAELLTRIDPIARDNLVTAFEGVHKSLLTTFVRMIAKHRDETTAVESEVSELILDGCERHATW